MSLLDVLIVLGFALAAYLGYNSGVARKAFTLAALLVALLAAARLMHPAGALLVSAGLAGPAAAAVGAFLVIFILLAVLAFLLLRRLASTPAFKRSGRAAGLVLGIVEGCLVMSILFWGLRAFDEPGERLRTGSRLYRPVLDSVPALFNLMKPYLPGAREFRELVGLK